MEIIRRCSPTTHVKWWQIRLVSVLLYPSPTFIIILSRPEIRIIIVCENLCYGGLHIQSVLQPLATISFPLNIHLAFDLVGLFLYIYVCGLCFMYAHEQTNTNAINETKFTYYYKI